MKACKHCGHTFSPSRLKAHQNPRGKRGGALCTLRFPCSLPNEPGCDETFAHERDRLRHRKSVCKIAVPSSESAPGFKCRCGKTIKRWYQFKSHHARCRAAKISQTPFVCQCHDVFNTMSDLERHHETEKGKPGRPRKISTPKNDNIEATEQNANQHVLRLGNTCQPH
ncbi:hypothetical protein F4808DRAFT_429740 [Astrocystis sublimbata]|nr:hypothetical protein F4808DRAFT_429740 [Astrocystis sublimbata]